MHATLPGRSCSAPRGNVQGARSGARDSFRMCLQPSPTHPVSFLFFQLLLSSPLFSASPREQRLSSCFVLLRLALFLNGPTTIFICIFTPSFKCTFPARPQMLFCFRFFFPFRSLCAQGLGWCLIGGGTWLPWSLLRRIEIGCLQTSHSHIHRALYCPLAMVAARQPPPLR